MNTTVTQTAVCPGPFFVANVTANVIMKDIVKDNVFYDPKAAALHVNELNMVSMGNPTYTVVDEHGTLIDHDGNYTQNKLPIYFDGITKENCLY